MDLKWGVASFFFFFCLTHTIKTKQQRDKKKRNNRVNWARKRKKVNKDRGGMRVCVQMRAFRVAVMASGAL